MEQEIIDSSSSSDDELDNLKPPSWKRGRENVTVIDIKNTDYGSSDLSGTTDEHMSNVAHLHNSSEGEHKAIVEEFGCLLPPELSGGKLKPEEVNSPTIPVPARKEVACQTNLNGSHMKRHDVGCQTIGTGDIVSLNLYFGDSPNCKSLRSSQDQVVNDYTTLQELEDCLDRLQLLPAPVHVDKETQIEELYVHRNIHSSGRWLIGCNSFTRIALTYFCLFLAAHYIRNMTQKPFLNLANFIIEGFYYLFNNS